MANPMESSSVPADVRLQVIYYHSNVPASLQDWKSRPIDLLALIELLNDEGRPILAEKTPLEETVVLTITRERDNLIAQITGLQQDHAATTDHLNEQINELNEQLEIANGTANDINTQLLAERRTIQTLNQAMTLMAIYTNPALRQKPANISDPPKFSGKHEDLEAFKNMVNIKLTGNSEQFPSDQHRLAYVYGRLEGNTLAQVQLHITEEGITLANVPTLLNILQTALGNPDPQGTATRKLRRLH